MTPLWQTTSIAVASPISIVQDNSHLWTTMPLQCYSKGVLCPFPNIYGTLTMSIDGQHCQTIAVTNDNNDNNDNTDSRCPSIRTFPGLLCIIAIIAAMLSSLCIVQGISTQYKIHPLMATAHCPKHQNALLRTMHIDWQRC